MSTSSTKSTKYLKDIHVGLQNGTDRTMFASWEFKNQDYAFWLDHFEYKWYYYTGNGTSFVGNSTADYKDKSCTYTAPENATKVAFAVKAVFKTWTRVIGRKGSVGYKEVVEPKYIDDWNKRQEYRIVPGPVKPSAPTVTLDKYKLKAELNNLDATTQGIKFEVYKNNTTRHYTSGIITVKGAYASLTINIEAGVEYKVRARAYKDGDGSDWSDFSANASSIPKAITSITSIKALSETSVQLDWPTIANTKTYTVQYTTATMNFDSNPSEVSSTSVDAKAVSHAEISGLESGKKYYFRVRAENDQGESAWSPIKNITIGTIPSPPTTWASTSTAIVGENVVFYWVHNSEDGSDLTQSVLRYRESGKSNAEAKTITLKPIGESGATQYYTFNTSQFTAGTKLYWSVRTRGILTTGGKFSTGYSDYSAAHTLTVYAPPTVSLSATGLAGVTGELESFPLKIRASAGPETQKPVGYHITVVSNNAYTTTDAVGNEKYVAAGEIIFSKYYNVTTDLEVDLGAGDINLDNDHAYTVMCEAAMNSGLTATSSATFEVGWDREAVYDPDIGIGIDYDNMSALINPFCEDSEGNRIEGVTLSVYRREFDGKFTEIATGIDNTSMTHIVDPHPALDYARYRVVATTEATGASSFYDPPPTPILETAAIIQWDEEWKDFRITDDVPEEPRYTGSILRLPYNIDVTDNNSSDVALVEYIGREHPVSYYGTQQGSSQTWNVEIPKSDKETLFTIRRLAKWMGDVYVREPSGSGYWAHISISYDLNHCELTIPVTIDITRVEGGI